METASDLGLIWNLLLNAMRAGCACTPTAIYKHCSWLISQVCHFLMIEHMLILLYLQCCLNFVLLIVIKYNKLSQNKYTEKHSSSSDSLHFIMASLVHRVKLWKVWAQKDYILIHHAVQSGKHLIVSKFFICFKIHNTLLPLFIKTLSLT